MEKPKVDPTLLHYLIERSKYDIAHARAKFPKQGTAISEKHPQRAANRLPRGEAGSTVVTLLISKWQVVQPVDDGGIQRALRCSVDPQPFKAFVIVDCVEAARIGKQSKARD